MRFIETCSIPTLIRFVSFLPLLLDYSFFVAIVFRNFHFVSVVCSMHNASLFDVCKESIRWIWLQVVSSCLSLGIFFISLHISPHLQFNRILCIIELFFFEKTRLNSPIWNFLLGQKVNTNKCFKPFRYKLN